MTTWVGKENVEYKSADEIKEVSEKWRKNHPEITSDRLSVATKYGGWGESHTVEIHFYSEKK